MVHKLGGLAKGSAGKRKSEKQRVSEQPNQPKIIEIKYNRLYIQAFILWGSGNDSKFTEKSCVHNDNDEFDHAKKEISGVKENNNKKKIAIKKMTDADRRAYFAKKKRESNARMRQTKEGRQYLIEKNKPFLKKYYNKIMSDPEKRAERSTKSALNQRINKKNADRPAAQITTIAQIKPFV